MGGEGAVLAEEGQTVKCIPGGRLGPHSTGDAPEPVRGHLRSPPTEEYQTLFPALLQPQSTPFLLTGENCQMERTRLPESVGEMELLHQPQLPRPQP